MSANCEVTVFFQIYGQFAAFQKSMVYKTYIFIKSNLTETENRTNTALPLLLWVKVLFLPKNEDFLQKNVDISRIRGLDTKR